jgi:hypothetical protein
VQADELTYVENEVVAACIRAKRFPTVKGPVARVSPFLVRPSLYKLTSYNWRRASKRPWTASLYNHCVKTENERV